MSNRQEGVVIVCAACGFKGNESTRFCGSCGSRLWEPCCVCNEPMAVDLKFCGGCGANLSSVLAEARAAATEKLDQAEVLAKEGRFLPAGEIVKSIKLAAHSQLRDLVELVSSKPAEYDRRRDEAVMNASNVLEETRRLVSLNKTQQAYELAETIPPALRNADLRELHEKLQLQVNEAKRLRDEVKKLVASKELDLVLPLIRRLRELGPLEPKIEELSKKLEARQAKEDTQSAKSLVKAAKQAVEAGEYRAAELALAEISPEGLAKLEDKYKQQASSIRERIWLAVQLSKAPYADESVVAIADRLVKLQPDDPKVGRLRVEIMRRWKESLRDHPGQPAEWAKQAGPTLLGPPIGLSRCPDLLVEESAKRKLSPGQFLVALGLALQGIGKGQVRIDLTPQTKSWKDLLALGGGKRVAPSAWGLDIGAQSLKAMRLTAIEAGGKPEAGKVTSAQEAGVKIDEVVLIPYERPASAMQPGEADTKLSEYAVAALAQFCEGKDLAKELVVVGLPGTLTLGRFFDLPNVAKSKFEEAIRYEARLRIPLDPESVQVDFFARELEDADEEAAKDKKAKKDKTGVPRRVAIVAASKAHIEGRLGPLKERGATALVVSSDCVALVNAVRFAERAEKGFEEKAVAIVDMGAKTSNIVVTRGKDFWFRGVYSGSDHFDHALVKERQMSWVAAEQTRRKLSKAAWMHEIDHTLCPKYDEFAEVLGRTLDQFRNETGSKIDEIRLVGGAAYQFGLIRRLRTGE